MKCKECTEPICPHRTTDGEKECYYYAYAVDPKPINSGLTHKELWIADVAVRILANCPYPYMSLDGTNLVPASEYAATQARQMADAIFGEQTL